MRVAVQVAATSGCGQPQSGCGGSAPTTQVAVGNAQVAVRVVLNCASGCGRERPQSRL